MVQWKPQNCLFFFSIISLVWFSTEQWLQSFIISTALKAISLLIPIQMWLKSKKAKLFKNKNSTKIQSAQTPEKYLWAKFVYEERDFLNCLLLYLYFSLRGDTLTSQDFDGICLIDLGFFFQKLIRTFAKILKKSTVQLFKKQVIY